MTADITDRLLRVVQQIPPAVAAMRRLAESAHTYPTGHATRHLDGPPDTTTPKEQPI